MNMQPARKRLIINYANISAEILEAIRKKYPLGWINHTIKVPTAGGGFFFAITVDFEDTSYLIKVPVKVDTKSEKDEDFFETSLDMKDSDEKLEDEDDEKDKDKEKDENSED